MAEQPTSKFRSRRARNQYGTASSNHANKANMQQCNQEATGLRSTETKPGSANMTPTSKTRHATLGEATINKSYTQIDQARARTSPCNSRTHTRTTGNAHAQQQELRNEGAVISCKHGALCVPAESADAFPNAIVKGMQSPEFPCSRRHAEPKTGDSLRATNHTDPTPSEVPASGTRASVLAKRLWRKAGSSNALSEALPSFDMGPSIQGSYHELEGQVTSITIHRTDELPHDWRIAQPMLVVHIINGKTGRPLRKSMLERASTTAHEGALEYLLPMMTRPFVLRGAQRRLPAWEEELVFLEDFIYLIHPYVFLLFELVDFSPDFGIRHFAWGFLKMVSGPSSNPGHSHALRPMPLRLQLYVWQPHVRPVSNQSAVWAQYLAAGRQRYSSTLYVSLRSIPPPQQLEVRFPYRPAAAHHVEVGRLSFEELQVSATSSLLSVRAKTASMHSASAPVNRASSLSREGGDCLLPNDVMHVVPGGALGATALAISPDGRHLVCALCEREGGWLAVHELLTGHRTMLLLAHQYTVHDLSWGTGSDQLLSVSADGTAKLWKWSQHPEAEDSIEPLMVFSHPTIVYCGKIQPAHTFDSARQSPLLVTGAKDRLLRIWDTRTGQLLAVKSEHEDHVNTLAWSTDGSHFYSGDAAGVLKHWDVVPVGAADKLDIKATSLERKELRGAVINSLALHPSRRRLLVQTRNDKLFSLDPRLQHLSARYDGHTCLRYNVRAGYSPDGRYVVAGSDNGLLFIWKEDTGDILIKALDVGYRGPLLQAIWAPEEQLLVMCSYGSQSPILVYKHSETSVLGM